MKNRLVQKEIWSVCEALLLHRRSLCEHALNQLSYWGGGGGLLDMLDPSEKPRCTMAIADLYPRIVEISKPKLKRWRKSPMSVKDALWCSTAWLVHHLT